MKRKHAMVAGALAALVAMVIAAFVHWSWRPTSESTLSKTPLRIGTLYWPGTFWIDIAREKGWFAEAGLDAEFVDANLDYYGALDALQEGALDTITIWLFDVVHRSQRGADLVMVLATDVSNGSEALIGAPHIESVSQLKGKRIGVALETALVYELDAMLSRFGLSLDDVTLVDMDPAQATVTLEAGKVDAVMSWEPHITEAIEAGGQRIYDSSKLPGLIMGGMAFQDEFIEARPQDIQRMLQVWHRATEYLKANPEEAFAVVAKVNNVTAEEVRAFSERNRIMDLRANLTAFTYASGLESLFGSSRKINRFLMMRDSTDKQLVEGTDLLDSRFVQELGREKGVL